MKLRPEPEGVRTAGAELTRMALLLARIRAWLTLQSPPSQGTFPYHLAFRQVVDGKLGEVKVKTEKVAKVVAPKTVKKTAKPKIS